MKSITPTLLTHLQTNGPFILADLYTITLSTAEILRWTSFDVDVTHPQNGLYTASGPVIERGNSRIVIGVEVDTLDMTLYPTPDNTLSGRPFLAAAHAGALDRARLVLERAFLDANLQAIGTVHLFSGRFADIEIGRTTLSIRCNSDLESLNVNLPRNLFQPGCINTLYDAACGKNKNHYGATAQAQTGSTISRVKSALLYSAGWFDRGHIRFINGDLAGSQRAIKSYASGQFDLFQPLPAPPATGSLFIAYPGCDRQQNTCQNKFNNLSRFRGCPYIPVPETAL